MYNFPQEHWVHLRTTNPIESILVGVRLRADVTKRQANRANALYLLFKVARRLLEHWRWITAADLYQLVLDGKRFTDGRRVEPAAAYQTGGRDDGWRSRYPSGAGARGA